MLKISRLADYALIVLQALSQQAPACASASQLAHRTQIALPTVSKLLKMLVEGGVLTSVRGTQGGYRLARAAEAISLAHIITAIDGDVAVTHCCKPIEHAQTCEHQAVCGVSGHWQGINQAIVNWLSTISLADLNQPASLSLWEMPRSASSVDSTACAEKGIKNAE